MPNFVPTRRAELATAVKYVGLPDELYEAAKIDGAPLPSIYIKIILPMMRPVFMSAIVILLHISIKSYDLVITMLSLEKTDTFDLATAIKATFPDIPIVVLTEC